MKALSVRQPWPWAIFHANPAKDIENRLWPTRFRGTVAIHAAKGMTMEEAEDASEFMRFEVGLEKLTEFQSLPRGAVVGLVDIVDCVDKSDSPWFVGDYGFVLTNPRPLPVPIECKGALGFWDVPAEIEKEIRRQLEGASASSVNAWDAEKTTVR